MNKYLIAIDLDGTALYDMFTMTEKTINTLKQVKELGHEVVISTGRAFRTSIYFYNLLNLNTPMINHNGALITNPKDKNFERIEKFIPHKDVINIFEENKDYIENSFAEYLEDYYVIEYNDMMKGLIHPDPNGGEVIEGSFVDTLNVSVNGFLIIAKENKGHLVEKYINEKYEGYIGSRNWGGNNSHIIEVFLTNTDKGYALEHVRDHLNIQPENVIAFGDGNNDVGMIKMAGIGISMKNGTPDALKHSDVTIGHHQEDGVANYLKEFFKMGEKSNE